MADDQKLTIGINVTADTRGAQQAQQAVQAVTSGTKQATQATAEAGQRAEGAARAWEGLRMSAQGGLQCVTGSVNPWRRRHQRSRRLGHGAAVSPAL